MPEEKEIAVGGQAVIEGVLMRGPEKYAIAVRKANGAIVLKSEPFISVIKKRKYLNVPILRGAIVLIETLLLGIKALSFSGDVAMEEEQKAKKKKSNTNSLWLAATMIFSLALGLAIFFYLPLWLTGLLHLSSGFYFNLVDGIIRFFIFFAYILAISRWKEIKRVFQYHGAEHKSIYAYEQKQELNAASARPFSTLHPRCGTSFLLIVMVISMLVFMLLGKPETIGSRLIRFAFIPVIGGISYELIKLSGKGYRNPFFRSFIVPGLWLQKITTDEPDDSQLEVAMVALKEAIGFSTAGGPSPIELYQKDIS